MCAAAAHCHRAFLSFLATRPSSFYNANIKNICSKWEIFHLSTSSLLLSDLRINAVCKNGSLLSVQGMRIFTENIFAIKFPPLEFVVNLLMEFRFLASQNLITSIPKAERYDMSRKKKHHIEMQLKIWQNVQLFVLLEFFCCRFSMMFFLEATKEHSNCTSPHQQVNAVQQIKINLLRNDDVQEVISFLIRFADSYHIWELLLDHAV